MSEYDIIVVANGIHTPVATGIHSKDRVKEMAEEWFKKNVKGRFKAKVMVVNNVTYVEESFVEDNPDRHEAKERDVDFDDFFMSENNKKRTKKQEKEA